MYLSCVAIRSDLLSVFRIINSSSSIFAKFLNKRFVFFLCQIKIEKKTGVQERWYLRLKY